MSILKNNVKYNTNILSENWYIVIGKWKKPYVSGNYKTLLPKISSAYILIGIKPKKWHTYRKLHAIEICGIVHTLTHAYMFACL